VRFVGFRTWANHRLLPKLNVRRFRRRVRWMRRAYARGLLGGGDVQPRLASWIGHARQVNSERLLDRLSTDWVFTRRPRHAAILRTGTGRCVAPATAARDFPFRDCPGRPGKFDGCVGVVARARLAALVGRGGVADSPQHGRKE
jgi:hypothetical protein